MIQTKKVPFKEDSNIKTSADEIIIVSGLPRSGTSMVMQMLCKANVPLLTDGKRQPDLWNPFGYFEYSPVKTLEKNNYWLETAHGAAVKVVSPLLKYLPNNFSYRMIFILRNLSETLASQTHMMSFSNRSGGLGTSLDIDELTTHLIDIRDWIIKDDRFTVLWLNHRALIKNPIGQAKLIAKFLNLPQKNDAMAAAVRPRLVHQYDGS